MNLVLFGPPGSGKGTQSDLLVGRFNMTHISTGDALRAAIREGKELGQRAKELISKGELVPDEMVTEMLRNIIGPLREETSSFLFDGYPRTIIQAVTLENLCEEFNLEHPACIKLHVPDKELMDRLTGRQICADCKSVFNIYLKPTRWAGVCDVCSGPLTRRVDDSAETVHERLRVYHEQSEPVIQHYRDHGMLYEIDASVGPDEVFHKITQVIEENY